MEVSQILRSSVTITLFSFCFTSNKALVSILIRYTVFMFIFFYFRGVGVWREVIGIIVDIL